MRVAGSWPFQLWLICTSACVCVCVLPSVHCPCSVFGCFPVLFPYTLHSATCAPVCLCCYCVCWLQFTQIWPYCRQVSLLWEVLQRDPGQQCDPGGRPSTATDVSYQARVADHHLMINLRDYQADFSLAFILWRGVSIVGPNINLVVSLSLSCSMISKEQFEKKKNDMLDSEPWVLPGQQLQCDTNVTAMKLLLFFFLFFVRRKHRTSKCLSLQVCWM